MLQDLVIVVKADFNEFTELQDCVHQRLIRTFGDLVLDHAGQAIQVRKRVALDHRTRIVAPRELDDRLVAGGVKNLS